MTAVLLDSVKLGTTGWISVMRSKAVQISGLREGDRLIISYLPDESCLFVDENGCLSFPDGAMFIKIEHDLVAKREDGESGVCVDLLKKDR